MKAQIKLGIILLLASLLIWAIDGNSQRISMDSRGNFVQVKDTAVSIKTGRTFTSADGKIYPVWKSAKGKYFVIRTSQKTGKQYRQYLKLN